MMKNVSLIMLILAMFFISCSNGADAGDDAFNSPTGENRAQDASVFTGMFGGVLYDADGNSISVTDLKAKKIGLYFSAEWCPPCRQFTPVLLKAYNELKSRNENSFELIFVSSDRSERAMFNYMKKAKMPWLAVAYEGRYRDNLARRYGIRSIPSMIIIDQMGNTLSTNARMEITNHGSRAYDMWKSK